MITNLDDISISADVLSFITKEQAWHYRILPVKQTTHFLEVYSDEEADHVQLEQELEVLLGKSVQFIPLTSSMIQKALVRYYRKEDAFGTSSVPVGETDTTKDDDFLLQLIGEARKLRSSDIHIETYEEKCRVRVRIDGMLVERYRIPKTDYPSLVNKIKITANLDIAEKRLPQDGRIVFNRQGMKFDIRVSVLPTLYGEKVVLRLLNNDATNIDIRQLGLDDFDLNNYLEEIRREKGMILISGPTGSGKTTTLYATLKLLNEDSRNILTIEDPIEYTLEGINQVQLKESIGLNFGAALRTFLRQDPNVIMVGEIRDPDTANMAIRASLTGHLVLSTIHTNSAWGTVSRLADMGVPSFLLASTLNATVAQRLVRLLCPHCKKQTEFNATLYPPRYTPLRTVTQHYVANGCDQCYQTGYKGRKAVYEVIPIDRELSEQIRNGEFEVSALLKQKGIRSLSDNAFELFERGDTSLDEVYPLLTLL